MDEGLCECGCGQRTTIPAKSNAAHGFVKGKPIRFVHGHNGTKRFNYRSEDRGHSSPCWIWQGKIDTGGYGACQRNKRRAMAHRVVYESLRGPIPADLQIDHLCRQRDCVNPDHLEPVVPAENSRRGVKAKITLTDAREIRRAYAAAPKTGGRAPHGFATALANRFGISPPTLYAVLRGRTWRE